MAPRHRRDCKLARDQKKIFRRCLRRHEYKTMSLDNRYSLLSRDFTRPTGLLCRGGPYMDSHAPHEFVLYCCEPACHLMVACSNCYPFLMRSAKSESIACVWCFKRRLTLLNGCTVEKDVFSAHIKLFFIALVVASLCKIAIEMLFK